MIARRRARPFPAQGHRRCRGDHRFRSRVAGAAPAHEPAPARCRRWPSRRGTGRVARPRRTARAIRRARRRRIRRACGRGTRTPGTDRVSGDRDSGIGAGRRRRTGVSRAAGRRRQRRVDRPCRSQRSGAPASSGCAPSARAGAGRQAQAGAQAVAGATEDRAVVCGDRVGRAAWWPVEHRRPVAH